MFNRIIRNKLGLSKGKGQGGGNKQGAGPQGVCVCPSCGYEMDHKTNQRCMDMKCPICGTNLVRK